MATRKPPIAASAEPMTKVNEMVRFVSMPIISAASRSCEVARIALPMRVPFTIQVSSTMSTSEMRMIATCSTRMRAPRTSTKPVGTTAVGMMIGCGPKMTTIRFCRMIETPIAESSAMMRERLRSGR
jgi:hypothetical protein